MTQAIQGYLGKVLVSDDGGVNYYEVAELRNYEVTVNRDEIDASSHSSQGWKSKLAGLMEWTAVAEALYIQTDTAQDKIWDALINGTVVRFKFRPREGTGYEEYLGEGSFRSWRQASPNADAAAINLEILGDGALQKQNQPA